jgi:hypothetical protein
MIGPLRNAELRTGRAFGHALAELGSFLQEARPDVLFPCLLRRDRSRRSFTGKLTERS